MGAACRRRSRISNGEDITASSPPGKPGIRKQLFRASKEQDGPNVRLAIGYTVPTTDGDKIAFIKEGPEVVKDLMKKLGATVNATVDPPSMPPVPTRVMYSVRAKDAKAEI